MDTYNKYMDNIGQVKSSKINKSNQIESNRTYKYMSISIKCGTGVAWGVGSRATEKKHSYYINTYFR